MTSEQMAAIAGVILSLLFSYGPGVSQWFNQMDGTFKRLFMAGLMAVVAAGAYGLSCAGYGADLGLGVTCDQQGINALIMSYVLAMAANQSVFALTPKKKAVQVKPFFPGE